MISFKQYLTELFDTPYSYTYRSLTGMIKVFEFTTEKNEDYQVMFELFEDNNWEVSFISKSTNPRTGTAYGSSLVRTKSTVDAARVYATVIKCIDDGIERFGFKRGDILTFSSADPKTSNIYRKFANYLVRKYNFKLQVHTSGKSFKLEKQ